MTAAKTQLLDHTAFLAMASARWQMSHPFEKDYKKLCIGKT